MYPLSSVVRNTPLCLIINLTEDLRVASRKNLTEARASEVYVEHFNETRVVGPIPG